MPPPVSMLLRCFPAQFSLFGDENVNQPYHDQTGIQLSKSRVSVDSISPAVVSKAFSRSVVLGVLLLTEFLVLSVCLDTGNLRGTGSLSHVVEQGGPWAVRIFLA